MIVSCKRPIAKGAAGRGRTEGAVLPEHSTTAGWNRLGVDFSEGGKPEYPVKTPRSQVEID